MTSSSLKSRAVHGVLWNMADKASVQAVQFVIGIVLARLLMPEDFGIIGMLSIFIAVSQSLIDSGMGSGLIQKKHRTEADFSTVFLFNLVVSAIIYLLLFFSAPLIPNFYKTPQLVLLTRVLCLNIMINALAITQRARLVIQLDFKSFAKVNALSVALSGGSAVFLAYNGWGMWALVAQNLLNSVLTTGLLWIFSKSKLSWQFSRDSFNNLFGFGSKLLAAGLYAQTLQNIYNLTIGKYYSAGDLGFYTRSKALAELTAGTVTDVLNSVSYPLLASIQEDRSRLTSVFSRLIKMTSFLIFPAMTLFALLADPFVRLLLTDKWTNAIVLLQWMCFARIFYPLSVLNMNILNAIGRSDLFLKVDLSKAPLIIMALIITIPMGLKAIVIGQVITSWISFLINAYLPGRLFGYGPGKQIRDMIPVFGATAAMALITFLSIYFINSLLLKLIVGAITGLFSYYLAAKIFKLNQLAEIITIAKGITAKK